MTAGTDHHLNRTFDVAVIGSGLAGMAAALYAANRGLTVLQIGSQGGILFTSGVLDLLAVHPAADGTRWDDPWAALAALRAAEPAHPYARVSDADIRDSFAVVRDFLGAGGMVYECADGRNTRIITAMGTIKSTWCVPRTMAQNAAALDQQAPCLFVDFEGLKEYSAAQVALTVRNSWPAARSCRVVFPGAEHRGEVYANHLAQYLELAGIREELAARIRPQLGDARFVGLPAVLGVKRTAIIHEHLEKLLGVPVFEVPTMPTSVPGLRLREVFDTGLPKKGVHRLIDKRVDAVTHDRGGDFFLQVGVPDHPRAIRTRTVVLATGRFMGKGLFADRTGVREPLFNLPVTQPAVRADWHHEQFMHARGHPINRAGVEVDDSFRPVNNQGSRLYDNLYAAGSILAHQDWMRQKCGSGLAFATAWRAVAELAAYLKNN